MPHGRRLRREARHKGQRQRVLYLPMKIIERGEHPKNKLYTVKCKQCGTKFEFEAHEGHVVRDQRDGDFIQINCPVCLTNCTHTL